MDLLIQDYAYGGRRSYKAQTIDRRVHLILQPFNGTGTTTKELNLYNTLHIPQHDLGVRVAANVEFTVD